mgnify:FL=1
MKNKNKTIQTSFVIDKELWLKFKSKTLREGYSVKDKISLLILDYVKRESKNASNWFRIPRW